MWAALRALWLSLLLPSVAGGFAVFGHVPEFRLNLIDWEGAVAFTTHLVLWSVVPNSAGQLLDNAKLLAVLEKESPLVKAIQKAGGKSPRILISVGGSAGRSEQFAEAVSTSGKRKALAAQLGSLMQTYPLLSGVELHWESPASQKHWRDLGRFAREVRMAMPAEAGLGSSQGRPVLTMLYHPGGSSVASFSSLKGKSAEAPASFVELFDFCHVQAFGAFDSERQHSTYAMDLKAVQEWESHGLPAQRLTLGFPLFGVAKRTAESRGYRDILAQDPFLKDMPAVDTWQGVYFVGVNSVADKVRFARRRGLAGVMLWELGQDVPATGADARASVLRTAGLSWQAEVSFVEMAKNVGERIGVSEEMMFMVLTIVVGGYFMLLVLLSKPVKAYDDRDWPPKRPREQDAQEANGSQARAEEPSQVADG